MKSKGRDLKFGYQKNRTMAKIAIIDDNKDQRDSFRIRLILFLKQLKSDLQVVDLFPFENFNDYYCFINDEGIVALIIDEKLHNDSQPDKSPVQYNGSDLVSFIRKRYKYIPVFTLTNYPEDQILQEKVNEFDYIFSKKDFTVKQVEIIKRACQRYLEENQKELSLYNELTRKIASGQSGKGDMEKLNALQEKLQIPLSTELSDREEWLKEFEAQIKMLEEIKAKLEKKLAK
jgi:hypothetical protein